ncbi:MAG TPA: helix-turn-helix domain-containing protein [Jatrophihabitans sp.]|jgi:DNA-binding transcriptional ArsR family regulator|uniref:ArsR/SmtB family transcription factor n=1 Tax=Jatrophihabitans sp. TaxID=1932789 RepID=UPI002EFAF255
MAAARSSAKAHSAARPLDLVILRDPRAIKALAHPARLAVIDELFAGRKLTATECGEIAGLSASAMSYHLRALEKWGIVRRSEATGDGRERPWEAAGEGLMVDSAEPRASAAGEAVLVARQLDRQRADILGWISGQDEAAAAWYDSTVISSGVFSLSHDEAKQLSEGISELVARLPRRSAADAPTGTRQVRVAFSVVPIPAGNQQPEPA